MSARDFVLTYAPRWWDQGRGITPLAHAIADWGDLRDIRDFTKLGVKIENSIAIKQKVAEQDTDDADELIAAGLIITDTRAWVRSVQKQAQAENAELREKLAVLDREAQRWANCKCVEIDSKLADYKTQALLLFAAKNDLGEISKRMDAGFAKLDDRLNLLFQKLDGKQDKKGRE